MIRKFLLLLVFPALDVEPDEEEEDVLTLSVKMPDGSRLKRRFLATDSVKVSSNTRG